MEAVVYDPVSGLMGECMVISQTSCAVHVMATTGAILQEFSSSVFSRN